MEKTASTPRIEYIDALRGFTMILVVLNHVAKFCLGVEGGIPSFHQYLEQVRMPMFFFISGFVLYKASTVWNLPHIGAFLKKKFPVQILSTAVFFLIYIYCSGMDLWDTLTYRSKGGYWFTYMLFIYYLFYCTIRFLARKHEDAIVVAVALIFYAAGGSKGFYSIPISDDIKGILSVEYWGLFAFFLIGTLVKKHFATVQKALDGKALLIVSILVYFLLNIFNDYLPKDGISIRTVQFTRTLAGMVLLFSFFRTKQATFSQATALGRSLQYIGRRTLDIYLLHYFLLPRQLHEQAWVSVFRDHPMPVLEFTFTLLIGLIVIAFCLLIGNIIRLSPTLAHWLFGTKLEKK